MSSPRFTWLLCGLPVVPLTIVVVVGAVVGVVMGVVGADVLVGEAEKPAAAQPINLSSRSQQRRRVMELYVLDEVILDRQKRK